MKKETAERKGSSVPVWVKDKQGNDYVSLHGVQWYPGLGGSLSAVFNWRRPEDILNAAADRAVIEAFLRAHPAPQSAPAAAAA